MTLEKYGGEKTNKQLFIKESPKDRTTSPAFFLITILTTQYGLKQSPKLFYHLMKWLQSCSEHGFSDNLKQDIFSFKAC